MSNGVAVLNLSQNEGPMLVCLKFEFIFAVLNCRRGGPDSYREVDTPDVMQAWWNW